MPAPFEIDLDSLARRVVAQLRVPSDARADLIQQAHVNGLVLLNRFQPRNDAGSATAREQAERFLFVSLTWQLRGYARRLRSVVPIPERDRRLARAYRTLIAEKGPLALAEAARHLGIGERRLASALAGSDVVVSLDRPEGAGAEGDSTSLGERIQTNESGPEQAFVAAIDEDRASVRNLLLGQVIQQDAGIGGARPKNRRRRVIYLFLDQLPDGAAEVIRLSYALPRKEQGSLRSCRTYGCRLSAGHEHSAADIARWVAGDARGVEIRLGSALEELGELLGGRDPRRLLREISAATLASDER